MKFDEPLLTGRLLRRYKRFLADVELADGKQITLHCPNTGSMRHCQDPGSRIWYTLSDNPKRKYPGTWQFIENFGGDLIGINTGLANTLAQEAVETGLLPALSEYGTLRREVPYGEQRSRIDLLLKDSSSGGPPCYIEVKSVTLGMGDGLGLFPDAVTTRGQKHLQELTAMVAAGKRAMLLFCVQHSGVERVRPADDIDPEYGELLRQAVAGGVEVVAFGAEFELQAASIRLRRQLPVEL